MSTKIEAFDGRVIFHVSHISPANTIRYEDILKELEDADAPHREKWQGWFRDFAQFMAVTENIEFHFKGDETEMLTMLKNFWQKRNKTSLVEQWGQFLEFGLAIHRAWTDAVTRASMPYLQPITAPEGMLSEANKAELASEDSPLDESE